MAFDLGKIEGHSPSLIGLKDIFAGAVCIPIIGEGSEASVLFEIRTDRIKVQPSDICLPGGGIKSGESPIDAAKREICEELLIDESQIDIKGITDIYHSDNIIIYPYVGYLKDYKGTFSRDEVAEVFTVPVRYFAETKPEEYKVRAIMSPDDDFPYERIYGGRNYKWRDRTVTQLFYKYGKYDIWGLTAKIIKAFADLIST